MEEKLADVVLEEADPDEWPGAGQSLANLSREDRGDRYWCKKNAAATFALLERTMSIGVQRIGPAPPLEADIDKQIAQREREAGVLLDAALNKARKTAFDERTIGKR